MQKTAAIVHLDGLDGATPLVGGYLKAYALADPEVRRAWRIDLLSDTVRAPASRVLRALVRRAPDLVAFSVYTWNAGLVRRLLPALRGLLPPTTRYLLGGVEVMHLAPRFVALDQEDVAVCNGEGELPFRQLLLELADERPDWARVGGLTFARDGAWHTTDAPPRVQDLTELVSPWLSGAFDHLPPPSVALFETNRGCPFACEFCYWGGAVGQKVYQQDIERLREELAWIARRGVRTLSLCDANFGLLPRDVELAEHIAALRQAHGRPDRIVFNSSKVRPERVALVSRVLGDAGLMTRHVFSVQSTSERALAIARRTGLSREATHAIQRRLNAERRPSIVELLWPMPGETLASFQDGIDELCRAGAQSFLVYPLLWLGNTGYEERSAELGVVTVPEADPASGGRIVVRTAEVSFEDYLEGLRFSLATQLLHNCRGLYATLAVLDALGVARTRDALAAFAGWMERSADGPLAELWHAQLDAFEDMGKMNANGVMAEAALHTLRAELDRLLVAFVASRPAWNAEPHGPLVRAALEHDLLARPYVFLQTPFALGADLAQTELLPGRPRTWRARTAYDLPRALEHLRTEGALDPAHLAPRAAEVTIDHRRGQILLLPSRTEDERRWMCALAVQELARVEPLATSEPVAARAQEGTVSTS